MSASDEDHQHLNGGNATGSSHNETRPLSDAPAAPALTPSPSPPHSIVNPISAQTSSAPRRHHAYAQVSTHGDEDGDGDDDDDDINNRDDTVLPIGQEPNSEHDPLYPSPPQSYYQRGFPVRITRWLRLIVTLTSIALACLSIAAVIDVSTPSYDGLEPARDERSIADAVLAAMDRSADPCENFYEYSCGSWLRSTKLPPDQSTYERSFSTVYDRVRLIIKDMLEGSMQVSTDPPILKAGHFYKSCIEQHAIGPINTLFLSPLRDLFVNLKDSKSFIPLFAKLNALTSSILFDMYIGADDKNPTQYAIFLSQVSLGMPHRDNYLLDNDHNVEMRKRYLNFMQSMLNIAGKARLIPRQNHISLSQDILAFETMIANFSKPPEEMQDPNEIYNKVLIKDMPKELYLDDFFKQMSIDEKDINGSIVIDNPSYFNSVNDIMKSLDTDVKQRAVVQAYLAFHVSVLGTKYGLLGESAYTELYKFKQFMYGIKQIPDRWKICQSLTNSMIGEAVGKAFVKDHFSKLQLNVAKSLSEKITGAFSVELKKLDWMDETTREAAESKLSALNWKIGYSTKLDEYTDVNIREDSLSTNVVECIEHQYKKSVDRLGKPVDKTEWFMLPQEVNAYYSPVSNEMVFPAGILQPPFFSDAYPDAMNFGSIGAVVGHEMSHGFDSSGRKYDKDGRLESWWSKQSAEEYDRRAKCYVDLFNTYKPRDVDIYVNGELTLNENLADTNGINVAYQAFKSMPNNSEDGIAPPNVILAKELTNDQLFFVAYAQTWCELYRPEALKLQMMTDPHSPGQFRVLGPLSQSDIFADAFQCRNGTKYNPTTKCHLW